MGKVEVERSIIGGAVTSALLFGVGIMLWIQTATTYGKVFSFDPDHPINYLGPYLLTGMGAILLLLYFIVYRKDKLGKSAPAEEKT